MKSNVVCLISLLVVLAWSVSLLASRENTEHANTRRRTAHKLDKRRERHRQVLVSYAYYEKDAIQKQNLDFFLTVGLGLDTSMQFTRTKLQADTVITVADAMCSPCSRLEPFMTSVLTGSLSGLARAIQTTPSRAGMTTVLWRRDNTGMDFASHNVTLTWVRSQRATYRYIIFLNSSVRGPFIPAYMPPGWEWTQAFTDRLDAGHSLVACSLTCLPDVDAGGPGPRAESWAFALDSRGLHAAQQRGVFNVRDCKLCDDGVVVAGEYGLSKAVLEQGLTMTTLLYRYRDDTDWSLRKHWHCNDNAHPSRQGTYGGISQHPFEILFVKASWGVGEPYTSTYTDWSFKKMNKTDTDGAFDKRAYEQAIA